MVLAQLANIIAQYEFNCVVVNIESNYVLIITFTDSETTFTSNVNLRGETADSGNDGSGDAGGSSDENRSLLQRDNSNDRNDDKDEANGSKA